MADIHKQFCIAFRAIRNRRLTEKLESPESSKELAEQIAAESMAVIGLSRDIFKQHYLEIDRSQQKAVPNTTNDCVVASSVSYTSKLTA